MIDRIIRLTCGRGQSSILQEESEDEEHAAKQDAHARGGTRDECARGCAALVVASSGGSLRDTTEASDWDLVCGRAGGGLGRRHCAQERRVAEVGGLGTAGVVGATGVLACVVAVAASYAFVAPCLADEEGEGLRVLGDVGDNTVLADAGVCEIIRIALVLLGGHRSDAGLLEADEGALRLVLLAPVRSV